VRPPAHSAHEWIERIEKLKHSISMQIAHLAELAAAEKDTTVAEAALDADKDLLAYSEEQYKNGGKR
jgi:hypothetical protein